MGRPIRLCCIKWIKACRIGNIPIAIVDEAIGKIHSDTIARALRPRLYDHIRNVQVNRGVGDQLGWHWPGRLVGQHIDSTNRCRLSSKRSRLGGSHPYGRLGNRDQTWRNCGKDRRSIGRPGRTRPRTNATEFKSMNRDQASLGPLHSPSG